MQVIGYSRRCAYLIRVGTLLVGVFAAPPLIAGDHSGELPTLTNTGARHVATEVDRLILRSLEEQQAVPAARSTDEDFLRRASLDLTGRIPTADEITLFGLSPDETKRADAIDRMLSDDGFAATWASYWREVIYSRATDVRARRTQDVFEKWLTDQFAANRPWDEIVTELITATGDTTQDGRTALMFAHGGDPAELAAETSRLFLGIQIQCANCHDHPYDSWKREDFHELAAFFPRVRVRRDPKLDKRTFVVTSADSVRDDGSPIDLEKVFRALDRDKDGKLTAAEAKRNPQLGRVFTRVLKRSDKDSDGALSKAELKEAQVQLANQPGRGSAEYYMPDLDDPAAQGTRTEPVFFIDERSVAFGTRDLDRRAALAESIVAPSNPWFARAFVNRVWSEMLGEGFYTPVDDMGPQRTAQLSEVLDLLASGFVANGYDLKWLYRTVALTEAYQRSLPDESGSDSFAAFAAMSPTRLRGDQIYNAIAQILDLESKRARGVLGPRAMRGQIREDFGRAAFATLFNYDPSTPQDEVMGNIPQALFLMNSPLTGSVVDGKDGGVLPAILEAFDDDSEALAEVYLRVLSREPTEAEAAICTKHLADVGDRVEAFEDIMWSLLNSSEFLSKR